MRTDNEAQNSDIQQRLHTVFSNSFVFDLACASTRFSELDSCQWGVSSEHTKCTSGSVVESFSTISCKEMHLSIISITKTQLSCALKSEAGWSIWNSVLVHQRFYEMVWQHAIFPTNKLIFMSNKIIWNWRNTKCEQIHFDKYESYGPYVSQVHLVTEVDPIPNNINWMYFREAWNPILAIDTARRVV